MAPKTNNIFSVASPGVSSKVEGRIREALANGKGIVSTARELGIGVSTVQRVRKEMAA